MKNLENYGVQEMDTKELINVDGGWFGDSLFDGVSWSGTGNSLQYAAEGAANGLCVVTNVTAMGYNTAAAFVNGIFG